MEWRKKTLNDNEELRKKIIDSYDSQLKDIFTEDEILAILDALKSQTLMTANPSFWPTIATNAKGTIDVNDMTHVYNNDNNMFKRHPESEPIYNKNNTVISSNTLSEN